MALVDYLKIDLISFNVKDLFLSNMYRLGPSKYSKTKYTYFPSLKLPKKFM
jgi:hypothetical protein